MTQEQADQLASIYNYLKIKDSGGVSGEIHTFESGIIYNNGYVESGAYVNRVNQQFDLKTQCPDVYDTLTSNQMICGMKETSHSTGVNYGASGYVALGPRSYDPVTGIYTIEVQFGYRSGRNNPNAQLVLYVIY